MEYNLAMVALCRIEWAGTNYQQEPCCPECDAPLYGKNSAVCEYVLKEADLPPLPKPYHALEPGYHFPYCVLDEALRTQPDLQTPQQRELVRRGSYKPWERIQEYIQL